LVLRIFWGRNFGWGEEKKEVSRLLFTVITH
jgi:hypothetical protein